MAIGRAALIPHSNILVCEEISRFCGPPAKPLCHGRPLMLGLFFGALVIWTKKLDSPDKPSVRSDNVHSIFGHF
jgi:hypothetical protein